MTFTDEIVRVVDEQIQWFKEREIEPAHVEISVEAWNLIEWPEEESKHERKIRGLDVIVYCEDKMIEQDTSCQHVRVVGKALVGYHGRPVPIDNILLEYIKRWKA